MGSYGSRDSIPWRRLPTPDQPVPIPASPRTLELRQKLAGLEDERRAEVGLFARAEASGRSAEAVHHQQRLDALIVEGHDVRAALAQSQALDRELDAGKAERDAEVARQAAADQLQAEVRETVMCELARCRWLARVWAAQAEADAIRAEGPQVDVEALSEAKLRLAQHLPPFERGLMPREFESLDLGKWPAALKSRLWQANAEYLDGWLSGKEIVPDIIQKREAPEPGAPTAAPALPRFGWTAR